MGAVTVDPIAFTMYTAVVVGWNVKLTDPDELDWPIRAAFPSGN